MTIYHFFTASPRGPISADDARLAAPLPIRRNAQPEEGDPTFGDYFHSIKQALSAHAETLTEIAAEAGAGPPHRVDIVSEKHGALYHPARVILHCGEGRVTLAANTAITPVGRARIWDESAILDELWKSFPEKYVPRVYFGESVRLGSGEPVDVFFTEWLEGYHEFHWSKPDTGPECVALWTDGGIVNLGPAETSSLYRNCAAVLAYYLDIATFKEIYDWRHEAGDFVASLGSENAPVKLIAARRYDTRIVFTDEITEPDTFPAAVWIMETSMRMRLDRLDGVGAFFLAPVEYIRPCLEGIFTTWAQKPVHTGAGPEFARRVLARVQSMPLEEIAEIFSAVFEGCHPDAADIGLIDRAMPEHVVRFVEETKRLRV